MSLHELFDVVTQPTQLAPKNRDAEVRVFRTFIEFCELSKRAVKVNVLMQMN